MEETKVRRSGPGIKPVVGMVVRWDRECMGARPDMKDVKITSVAGRDIHFDDGTSFDVVNWNKGVMAILSSPSPDPGEAPWPLKVGDRVRITSTWTVSRITGGMLYLADEFGGEGSGDTLDQVRRKLAMGMWKVESRAADIPADPRDVAIARWPWMAPFRAVQVGDRVSMDGVSTPLVVEVVHWVVRPGSSWPKPHVEFDTMLFDMENEAHWRELTPYREAKPVEACKDVTCGTIKAGDAWYCSDRCREECDRDPPDPRDNICMSEIQKTPRWTCSNGKECRTPGAPRYISGSYYLDGIAADRCVPCAEAIMTRKTLELERDVAAEREAQPKPRPQPGYTKPGEHAQLALNGGWRRGWMG